MQCRRRLYFSGNTLAGSRGVDAGPRGQCGTEPERYRDVEPRESPDYKSYHSPQSKPSFNQRWKFIIRPSRTGYPALATHFWALSTADKSNPNRWTAPCLVGKNFFSLKKGSSMNRHESIAASTERASATIMNPNPSASMANRGKDRTRCDCERKSV